MKRNFVDSKYNCRSEILLHIWKIKVNLKYNFEGLKNSDMVKHELQVTSCDLLVTRSKLKSSSWSLKARVKIQKCEFQSTSYEFKSTSYEFKSTTYEFKSTGYEFKSTSYQFKSTSSKIIKSMKIQVNGNFYSSNFY